jgi:mono/diheme cytochrome c family protein
MSKVTVLVRGTTALLMASAACLLLSQPAAATEQYAKQTGKSCAACHQAAKGGGALTPEGEKFKAAEKKPQKSAQ